MLCRSCAGAVISLGWAAEDSEREVCVRYKFGERRRTEMSEVEMNGLMDCLVRMGKKIEDDRQKENNKRGN